MAQQTATISHSPYPARFADTFVVFSVTVMSLAIGAWALLQHKLALWEGMIASLAVYSALLSIHLIARRNFMSFEETLADLEEEGPWTHDGLRRDLPQSVPGGAETGVEGPPADEIVLSRRPASPGAVPTKTPPGELPQPRGRDPFHYRPAHEPTLSQSPPAGAPTLGGVIPGASQPELSVEVIQDLIKKLADELNGTTPGDVGGTGKTAAVPPPIAPLLKAERAGAAPPSRTMAPPPLPPGLRPYSPPPIAPSLWPDSVPRTDRGGNAGPPPPPPQDLQLARIAEAIAAERMEVMLEPIHSLAEGRTRHFEVSMRLLTADGQALEQRELARLAQGSGLMGRIDAARMIRAARVACKLGERGRSGAVLTTVTGESLVNESFLDATTGEAGIAGRMSLVLSFTQSEVRAFTPGHTAALATLAKAGFGFALEEVTDLDMDFARLKPMGFQFVKLDAPVFLEGLPGVGARVPASDICRHLSDFGLTLIVGHIEDDWLLARILGFGVLFGKGAVFGGPRQVKDEVVAGFDPA